MPYANVFELPGKIISILPENAQAIFVKAFNDAWTRYANEPFSFKMAWTAVKNAGFRKNKTTGLWRKNDQRL